MLITGFTVLALAWQTGQVVTLAPQAVPRKPGVLNWVLREPAVAVSPGTRAFVTRIAPESIADVVEVRLYDGTHRLVWLDRGGLTGLPTVVAQADERKPSSRPQATRRGDQGTTRTNARRGGRADFAALDAAAGSLFQTMMGGDSSSSSTCGVACSMGVVDVPSSLVAVDCSGP